MPPTIKEAIIELADCNTSLIHLGSNPPGGPLRLATENEYLDLYQRLASGPTDYDVLAGQPGEVLGRLKPAYHDNKYWRSYYNSGADTYCDFAWKKLVPIEAALKRRLTASAGDIAKVRVSPVPRVLLYPFGWSTWISLRILGEHSLPALAALLQRFLQEPAYTLAPDKPPKTCTQVFEEVGKSVWMDAFGGGKNTAFRTLDVLSVTTVLDKYNGAPSLGALSPDEKAALATLISDQTPAGGFPPEVVHGLRQGGKNKGILDYALQKGYAVFIWADHRLKSVGRNHQHLRCYHNNTFLSLLHAWQLTAFLDQASDSEERSEALDELVKAAMKQINRQLVKKGGYRNICLLSYLQHHHT